MRTAAPGMKGATIREVAQFANVSPTAVSRYLNKQIRFPVETEERIDAAIEALRYVPNAIARRLSRRSSETIGFITADIGYPFFAAIASAAEEAAEKAGYSLTILNSRNAVEKELRFLSGILDHRLDGALLLTNHVDDGRLRDKINAVGRIILVDEDVPGSVAPRLFAENAEGARLAVAHLIGHGHERIAYIGGPRGLLSGDERLAGYRRAHDEAGLPVHESLVLSAAYSEDVAYESFRLLWGDSGRPTAVFSGGDLLAMGIIRAARDLRLSIPQDFSLVSFDDMPHAALLCPPLTTVRQSSAEFGRRGVDMLLRTLGGEEAALPEPRIGVELVVRESVSAPPGGQRPRGRSR